VLFRSLSRAAARAIGNDSWARIRYVDGENAETERTIVPLGLYFWGRQWLCAAYCWLRVDYRSFRVDRIAELERVPSDAERLARATAPITLDGYVRAMEEREAADRRC